VYYVLEKGAVLRTFTIVGHNVNLPRVYAELKCQSIEPVGDRMTVDEEAIVRNDNVNKWRNFLAERVYELITDDDAAPVEIHGRVLLSGCTGDNIQPTPNDVLAIAQKLATFFQAGEAVATGPAAIGRWLDNYFGDDDDLVYSHKLMVNNELLKQLGLWDGKTRKDDTECLIGYSLACTVAPEIQSMVQALKRAEWQLEHTVDGKHFQSLGVTPWSPHGHDPTARRPALRARVMRHCTLLLVHKVGTCDPSSLPAPAQANEE
jgi:hypothetical protein